MVSVSSTVFEITVSLSRIQQKKASTLLASKNQISRHTWSSIMLGYLDISNGSRDKPNNGITNAMRMFGWHFLPWMNIYLLNPGEAGWPQLVSHNKNSLAALAIDQDHRNDMTHAM